MALEILCKILSLNDPSPVVMYVMTGVGGRGCPIYYIAIQRETPVGS